MQSAFENCSSLMSIVMPNGVFLLDNNAFKGCTNLIIYSEKTSQPISWSYYWNYDNRPVYWLGQWHYDIYGNPVPNE
jgi:hypothetical protein